MARSSKQLIQWLESKLCHLPWVHLLQSKSIAPHPLKLASVLHCFCAFIDLTLLPFLDIVMPPLNFFYTNFGQYHLIIKISIHSQTFKFISFRFSIMQRCFLKAWIIRPINEANSLTTPFLFSDNFSALNRIWFSFSSVRKILNSTVSMINKKNMLLWDGIREDFL